MSKESKETLKKIGAALLTIGAVLGYAFLGYAVEVTIHPQTEVKTEIVDTNAEVVEAEEQVPALVEVEEGVVEEQDLKTVEKVDGGEIPVNVYADGPEAAQGFAIDISTPWAVINALNGQCIYLNNPYGSQCYNTTALIMKNQVGYWPSTAGTGAARGIWDDRDWNARGGYELIYDATQLRPGDLFVTWGGEWGHTGMVAGYYNNGYVPVFSTNQGGTACSLGGSAANTINLSMATFSGALRWHGWDYLFEEPEPTPSESGEYVYATGDTFGQVLLNQGYATENGLWGPEGDVQYYNAQLFNQGILNFYDGKYWNNIPVGTEIRLEHR